MSRHRKFKHLNEKEWIHTKGGLATDVLHTFSK